MAQTKSIIPEIVIDPVLQQFRLYEDKGLIHFTRHFDAYRGRGSNRHFVYYLESRELWRVYAKTKRKYKQVPGWHQPTSYIHSHRLQPVLPKHLILDRGL